MQTGRHNLLLRWARLPRQALGAGIVVMGIICSCAPWFGCTPERKYQTLSFFFDGVPDPNSLSVNKNNSSAASLNSGHAPLTHQHEPFAKGNCIACHGPDKKKIDVAHIKDSCLSCHPLVEKQYPLMHAPLVTGECLWCHQPHESNEAYLLRASSVALCTQCHDRNTLAPDPPEHVARESNCLSCHLAHGGLTHDFLRPVPRPTTRPAEGGPS